MSTQATTQQAELQHPSRVSLRANVGQVLCVIVPPIIWFAPLDIEAGAKHALAITSFMLLAWITEAMDYAVAGLIGCYLYWALKVAPFNVAFGGFATDGLGSGGGAEPLRLIRRRPCFRISAAVCVCQPRSHQRFDQTGGL